MCGIFGEIAIRGSLKTNKKLFLNALDALSHRGPDDKWHYISDKVSFGHRRLSIIDLSKKGKQPMFSIDKNHMITFNGEIYNYRQLRDELRTKGYKFSNNTDTEVLLNGMIDQGVKFIEKCNGMFSFAYHNFKNNISYIFRDRLGIKPLFYQIYRNQLIFSSEVRPLTNYKNTNKNLDLNSIYSYLSFRQPIGNQTYFKEIKSLEPGFFIEISNGKIVKKKYWDFEKSFEEANTDKGENFYIQTLNELMASSVNYRLISDVNVASLLSGGVDSSIISALIKQRNIHDFNAFSIGYDYEGFNEFKYSSIVAKSADMKHRKIISNSTDYFEDMDKIIRTKGQPVSIPNEVSQYRLCKEIKKYATVVLSGTGADEIFSGYGRIFGSTKDYYKLKSKRYFKNDKERRDFLKNFKSFYGKTNFKSNLDHFYHLYSYNSFDLKKNILDNNFNIGLNDNKCKTYLNNFFKNTKNKTYDSQMQYLFTKFHLKGILERDDFSSMLASVELRVPFLDHRIVEFAATIPNKYKLKVIKEKNKLISEQISENYDIPKYILRRSFKKIIPNKILNRPKVGFPVPLDSWMNNSKVKDRIFSTLTSLNTKNRGIISQKFINKIVNKKDFTDKNLDSRKYQSTLASSIWMCYNLETFLNENKK